MNADLYVEILQTGLLSFIQEELPDSHRFMQDNDPKHTSRRASRFLSDEESTGGKPHLNLQILILLKIYGTN